jgi:Domain of unknown function (DUF1844)
MADESSGASFTAYVLSLASTAAVHFGDLENPVTGSREMNLQTAGHLIDVLAMLEEKTRGNLSLEERQLLEQVLYELRMRFVEAQGTDNPPRRIITP